MKERGLTAYLCLCFCILFAADTVSAESRQGDKRGTISVSGTASENYPPDTAEIVLAIENTALSVSQATEKNNKVSEKVIRKLKDFIHEDGGDTISTSAYSLQPVYEYDQAARINRFTGYKVTNQITVKTNQITNVGGFIDSATGEGANRVDTVNFTLSDDRNYCKDLIRKAMEKAKSQAETVANSLDTRIAGVKDVSASCGSETQRPLYRFGMAGEEAMAAKSPTPVEAGTVLLQGSVNAVFYIDSQ